MINTKSGPFQIFTHNIGNDCFLAAIGQCTVKSIHYEEEDKDIYAIEPAEKVIGNRINYKAQENQLFATDPVR